MTISLGPTKIKQSMYLLIPKNIAELLEIKDDSKLSLFIKKNGNKHVLEYHVEWEHATKYVII